MQRRIQKPDSHRSAGHDLEQFNEIGTLHRQQLGDRRTTQPFVVGENHLADRLDTVRFEKHVLSPTEPDALGAKANRGLGVGRRIGVRPHAKTADFVGPTNQG